MMTELNIHCEGSGIIPAFDTPVMLVTGGSSVAFFDYIGEDSYEMGDKVLTRAEAEATIDTMDSAYIAGICGENEVEGVSESCFIWLNEMRLTGSVVAEESQHCAQHICCENQLSADGEICVELTHEATEAVTLALTDAGFTVRNDIATEDAVETPEPIQDPVTVQMPVPVTALEEITAKVKGVFLNSWSLPGWVFNAGMTEYSMDDTGTFHIMLFDDVGSWWSGSTPAALIQALSISEVKAVTFWINSPGGYVNEASAMRSIIARSGVPVRVNLLGNCSSAATFLGLFPEAYISMDDMGWQMFHHIQTWAYGDAVTLRAQAEISDMLDAQMFEQYGARCGMTGAEFMALVDSKDKRELYLSAKQCLEMGLINQIGIDQMPMFKASASVSDKYKNMTPPKESHTISLTNNSTPTMDVNEKASLFDQIKAIFTGSAPAPQNKAADPKGEGEEKKPDPMAAITARMDALEAEAKAKDEKIAALEAEAKEATKEDESVKASREAFKKMPPVVAPSAMATNANPVDKTADPSTSFVNKVKAVSAELGVGL